MLAGVLTQRRKLRLGTHSRSQQKGNERLGLNGGGWDPHVPGVPWCWIWSGFAILGWSQLTLCLGCAKWL